MGKVKASIRLYRMHDLDLISFIETHEFDFRRAMYCALKAFSKNQHFVIDIPPLRSEGNELDLKKKRFNQIIIFLDEDIDADAIEVLSKVKEGGRNNFLKNLLRLYLCNPISESFLNDINDAPYFYEKFDVFKKDRMLVDAGTEAKSQKNYSQNKNNDKIYQTYEFQQNEKSSNKSELNIKTNEFDNKTIEQPLSENIPSESVENSEDIIDMFSSIIG